MLIILRENIRNLGNFGEVVKVKSGYARNFLFPYKKAVRATKANLAEIEEQRLLMDEENTKNLDIAREIASRLYKEFVILVRQASEEGKIFGSITTREIVKALPQDKYQISHRNVHFNEQNIKNLGEYQVNIELHSEIIVPVALYVVRSEAEAAALRQSKEVTKKVDEQSHEDGSKI